MGTKTITVKTDEENPEPVEIIADSIIKISEGFDRLMKTKLSRRALLLLIHDNCSWSGGYPRKKPTIKEIENVLDSVKDLKKSYIK